MRALVGGYRRTSASLVAAVTALVLLAVAAPAQAEDCPFADNAPGTAATSDLASATLCLLNQERAAAGLQPLASSAPLATTADKYANYMVSDEHFAHQDEDGHNVVDRVLQTDPSLAGRWLVIGENLGWGTYDMATPRAMVRGWMASPTHRDNILYPRYDEIGVGIAEGAPVPDTAGALTYTTVFGKVAPQDQQDQQAGSTGSSSPAPIVTKARRLRAQCVKAKRQSRRQHGAKAARSRARAKKVCAASKRIARKARAAQAAAARS